MKRRMRGVGALRTGRSMELRAIAMMGTARGIFLKKGKAHETHRTIRRYRRV